MKLPFKTFFESYNSLSLKQRYLNFTILFSITFIAIAYLGWIYVSIANEQQLKYVQNRSDAADAMHGVINQIHVIETSLYQFLNEPTLQNEKNIKRSLQLFDTTVESLRHNAWVRQDQTLTDIISGIGDDSTELFAAAKLLINVRKDENEWIPAVGIMQTSMYTDNTEFITAISLLIDELGNELDTPGEVETYKNLNELRHWWETMIAEFRLLITNKFGFFTIDTVQGMVARITNMDLYIDRVDSSMVKLEALAESGNSEIINSNAIASIRNIFYSWTSDYNIVTASLAGEDWRHDRVIMQEQIIPVFIRISEYTSRLRLELSVASVKNINYFSELTRELTKFIIFVSVFASIAGFFSFFLFHRHIVRLINNFGLALKAEAKGQYVDTDLYKVSKAEEFRNLIGAFEQMRDEIRTRESHLNHMVHHDSLTQLPNRVLLRDRLELAISRSLRNATSIALLFLDLDKFKQINDSIGHSMGDKLLIEVASRLKECVRDTDTVSRLGGDEFTILLEEISNVDQVAHLARKIQSAIAIPFKLGKSTVYTSASIGIAMGPSESSNPDVLIKDADIAMYHAKDLGRGNYKFYSEEMAARAAEYMVLENQLRLAIDNNEFFLLYQPVIDMRTELITSTEALLRWNHPKRGVLAPDDFIRVIEDSGLIRPVTQWVLDEACRQHNKYKALGYADVRMAINLSGAFLKNNSVLDLVINTIEHTGIDPKALIMEITEDTLLDDLKGSDKSLLRLKEMGISIALDDFGTGQSSLSHLRMEPIDIVKIDRSFVRDIPADEKDMELVDAIIAMAHKLRMKVVAEGVETEEQLAFLRWHNCDSIQGYYYSKPCDGESLLKLLSNERFVAQSG